MSQQQNGQQGRSIHPDGAQSVLPQRERTSYEHTQASGNAFLHQGDVNHNYFLQDSRQIPLLVSGIDKAILLAELLEAIRHLAQEDLDVLAGTLSTKVENWISDCATNYAQSEFASTIVVESVLQTQDVEQAVSLEESDGGKENYSDTTSEPDGPALDTVHPSVFYPKNVRKRVSSSELSDHRCMHVFRRHNGAFTVYMDGGWTDFDEIVHTDIEAIERSNTEHNVSPRQTLRKGRDTLTALAMARGAVMYDRSLTVTGIDARLAHHLIPYESVEPGRLLWCFQGADLKSRECMPKLFSMLVLEKRSKFYLGISFIESERIFRDSKIKSRPDTSSSFYHYKRMRIPEGKRRHSMILQASDIEAWPDNDDSEFPRSHSRGEVGTPLLQLYPDRVYLISVGSNVLTCEPKYHMRVHPHALDDILARVHKIGARYLVKETMPEPNRE